MTRPFFGGGRGEGGVLKLPPQAYIFVVSKMQSSTCVILNTKPCQSQ